MALINFSDIDFDKSTDKELKTFDFNGSEIAIVPYLSVNDKYDLVMITLQKSLEKGIYNEVKLDAFFELHLVQMYTNLVFTKEEFENEEAIYDIMKRSGFIDEVISCIDPNEIATLRTYIEKMKSTIMKYRNTFGTVVGSFLEQVPEYLNQAKTMLESIDAEKISSLESLGELFKNIK